MFMCSSLAIFLSSIDCLTVRQRCPPSRVGASSFSKPCSKQPLMEPRAFCPPQQVCVARSCADCVQVDAPCAAHARHLPSV